MGYDDFLNKFHKNDGSSYRKADLKKSMGTLFACSKGEALKSNYRLARYNAFETEASGFPISDQSWKPMLTLGTVIAKVEWRLVSHIGMYTASL